MGHDPLQRLRVDPGTGAVLTDFDGTLAPIVEDPAAARPLPEGVDALRHLAGAYGLVGVVSGRPVSFLRERLGDDLWLSGLYGLETWEGGRLVEAPQAAEWRPVVAAVAARAAEVFGADVEEKGLSLTLHFRRRPDTADHVLGWARHAAAGSGLAVRPAKASVELHPPVHLDKGTVVERAAAGLRAACFLGDDVGDLPAFDALDRLAADGLHTVRVGVRTAETPPELLARADVTVDGPRGVAELLRSLR